MTPDELRAAAELFRVREEEWQRLHSEPTPAERAEWSRMVTAYPVGMGATIRLRLPKRYQRLDATEPVVSSVMADELDRWFQL